MRTLRSLTCVAGMLLAGVSLSAQFGRGGAGMQMPRFRGVLNTTIGAGAVYDMKSDTANGDVEIALIATENVSGKAGYWIQMSFASPEGQMDMKQLVVVDGNKAAMTRMIMQMQGMGPMEMPPAMIGTPTSSSSDVRGEGTLVGTESIATPAGTFSCQHYRGNDGGQNWEVWINQSVSPWGLVKSKDFAGEMTIKRVLTGVNDRITGAPQQMNFPGVIPGGPIRNR